MGHARPRPKSSSREATPDPPEAWSSSTKLPTILGVRD